MLNKTLNQENIIMMFFIVMLVISSLSLVIDKCMIDIIYFGVVGYYFCRFLVIRNRR